MDELVVGSRLMNPGDFDRLPIGTQIGERGGSNTFVKGMDGWLCENSGVIYTITDFSMGYNEIRSIPKGKELRWESLAQWQFKYRDNCYLSAESAGVSTAVVTHAMEELGIGDDYFPLGRGAVLGSGYDKERLPVGTQVTVGRPETVNSFGLFVKVRYNEWSHILGETYDHSGCRVTVVSGDEAAWAVTPGTEEEQSALPNFKAKAWRIGWKVKLSNRWCESYEEYMGRIGLTEDVLSGATFDGYSIGERLAPASVAILPEGSILRWQSRANPLTFTWYVRTAYATNAAGTRALFGHRVNGGELRNSASSMELVYIANEDEVMDIRVDNLDEIREYLPVGTRLRASGSEYVLCLDRRVTSYEPGTRVPDTGPWSFEQIGNVVSIAGVPVVTVYSLADVLNRFPEVSPGTRQRMYEALVNREDGMAEVMHLAGAQFGLFPQIVAEVLAEVGLGTPKSDTEREMIRVSFLNLMEELRRAQAGEGPMPTP